MDDAGAAFSMGCIGGSIFSYWKGYRNSPMVSVIWSERSWTDFIASVRVGYESEGRTFRLKDKSAHYWW